MDDDDDVLRHAAVRIYLKLQPPLRARVLRDFSSKVSNRELSRQESVAALYVTMQEHGILKVPETEYEAVIADQDAYEATVKEH